MKKDKLYIYLDMDEILTDFVGGVCRLHYSTKEDLYSYWEPGQWDMVEPLLKLRYATNRSNYFKELLEGPKYKKDEWFWNTIDAQDDFWHELEFLPDAIKIIDIVSKIDPDFCIVTSPSLSDECYSGKVYTIRKLLGSRFNNFFINSEKYRLAKPNTVLIDDKEENVEKFISNGGNGILYPARHNSSHKLINDKLLIIENQL